MFPTSKLKPFIVQAPRESAPEEIVLEDASLELCVWGNALSDLTAAIEAAGYAVDDDLASELAAFFQFIEDAGLSLDTLATDYDLLQTWMAAYYLSLEDGPLNLQTVATSYEHLLTAFQTVATGYLNLSMILASYGLSKSSYPTFLHAAGYQRQNLASCLAAVSSTVLIGVATYLSATDGTTLTSLGLNLLTRSRVPSFTSLVAQRVSAIATEVS